MIVFIEFDRPDELPDSVEPFDEADDTALFSFGGSTGVRRLVGLKDCTGFPTLVFFVMTGFNLIAVLLLLLMIDLPLATCLIDWPKDSSSKQL